jgi:hypothetical protein
MRERERECVQESGEKESCNGSSLAAIAAAARAAMRVDELSRVDVILLLHVFIVFFLYL